MACLEDTILALSEHGIQRFLIRNGHGGNRAAISVLASQVRYEDDLMVAGCTWFEPARETCHKFIPKRRVHADEIEAAMGLYLAPQVVRKAALSKGGAHPDPYPYTDPGASGGFEVPYRWEGLTPNGTYGDARRATVTMGEELTKAFLQRAGEFIESFMTHQSRLRKRR